MSKFDRGMNPHDGSRRRLSSQAHKSKHKYNRKDLDDPMQELEEFNGICPFTLDPCTCESWDYCKQLNK